MSNLIIYPKKFTSVDLKNQLLKSRTMYVDIKSYNKNKTVLFMKYLLDYSVEELYKILNELNLNIKPKSDGFLICLLYYILVNNERIFNKYKYNYNIIDKNSKKNNYNYVRNLIGNKKEYDDAAIYFYNIYEFDPLYDNKRKVKFFYDPYINEKINNNYLTIFKFFNHKESIYNPLYSIYTQKIILELNENNYIKYSEKCGIVYDQYTLGSKPIVYIEYFVRNFDDNILKKNIQGLPYTQLENILFNKIKYFDLPRFKTIQEQNEYKKKYDTPSYVIIGDFEQVKQLIFTKNINDTIDDNIKPEIIYKNEKLKNYINFKLSKFFSDDKAVLNTAAYLYYHMRSGIYCEIKNNKLIKFFIFVNPEYENNWDTIKFRGIKNFRGKNYENIISSDKSDDLTLEEYAQFKSYFLTELSKKKDSIPKKKEKENYIPIKNWWSNAYVIDNVMKKYPDSPIIGTNHCDTIIDFLIELCQTSRVKDCRFFINKRDHPMLRDDLTGPYKFLSTKKINYEDHFAPILSWTGSDSFRDILIPNVDDLTVTMDYCPLTSDDMSTKPILENRLKYDKSWNERIDKVIFLGSTTGPPRSENNQRVQLCKKFEYNPLFKVGITQVNYRDKVYKNNLVEFTTDDILLTNKIPMIEQVKYKYIMNIDGHAAAYRNLTLHYLGFLVFKVDSLPEREDIGRMWIDQFLTKNEDYVQIDYNFNNLESKVNYFIQNQDEAKKILENVNMKLEYDLSRQGMLNYMNYLLNSI